jgi:1-acyl-sn-glycerol-3-phosphate acyltransferase
MGGEAEVGLLYWVFKWLLFVPVVRLICRPWIEGADRIPAFGPAILVGNHVSAGDTFLLPLMIKRRLTFPAKAELFTGRGFGPRVLAWFLRNVGQLPMDRSGGRASASSMDGVTGVLRQGELLGIFPEGTRSPDGRLYKGKTGVARLVLQSGVPVVPVGMIDTELVPSRFGIPIMRRPGIRVGTPLDFIRYAGAGNDRDVLRWITDEIMGAVQDLTGQTYVDLYGSSAKDALREGRELPRPTVRRPGEGRSAPPIPGAKTPPSPSPGVKIAPTNPLVDLTVGSDVAP